MFLSEYQSDVFSVLLSLLLGCFSVNISRMYLGVHSPADLLFGSSIGLCVLYLYTQYDDIIYNWLTHGSYGKLVYYCIL